MRLRIAAAALVVAASAAFAAPGGDPFEPLRPALARQDQLVEKGDTDTLLAEARAAAKDATPESLYLLGRALGNCAVARRAQGRDAEFRDLLSQSERAFQDSRDSGLRPFAPAFLGLARCARYRGDSKAAEPLLREALRIAPQFRAATMDLAQVLAELERPKDAAEILQAAIRERSDDLEARFLLGMVLMTSRDPQGAEAQFRAVAKAQPENPAGRKFLGTTLLQLRRFQEAAQELETYRRMVPKDEETYRSLFVARMKMKDREGARRVLDEARRDVPGTQTAKWAEQVAAEYGADPAAFEQADEKTPEALRSKIESPDMAVVEAALGDMLAYDWDAIPAQVYRLLAPQGTTPGVRRAALRLIGRRKDPRALTLLEILLFHPRERDPDDTVRREAAKALAELPTPGIVPVLLQALDSADVETREAAVRGIAAQTGKYFREDLAKPTPAEAWAAERALYERWWTGSASGSVARRDAALALAKLFEPISQGRRRLAAYALPAVEDGEMRTWRAGYDLFRALTGQDFGAATGEPDADTRRKVSAACREWFAANGNRE